MQIAGPPRPILPRSTTSRGILFLLRIALRMQGKIWLGSGRRREEANELVTSLRRRKGFWKEGVHVAHACCQSRPAHFACVRARWCEGAHASWLGGGCKGGQLSEDIGHRVSRM